MGFAKQKELLKAIAETNEEGGWVPSFSYKKRGMESESRYFNEVPWMRCRAPLDAPVLTAVRIVGNSDYRMKYEKNVAVCKILKRVGVNLGFGY